MGENRPVFENMVHVDIEISKNYSRNNDREASTGHDRFQIMKVRIL